MTPGLVVLSPIAPERTGNGLAMRVAHLVSVAEHDRDVIVVVMPVAGAAPGGHPGLIEIAPDEQRARAGIPALLADERWRDRLSRAEPLPRRARQASPGLVGAVLAALPGRARGMAVHVARSYLAPLGLAVAEAIGAPWTTLDLDDDDTRAALAAGDADEAAAYDRVVRTFAPAFGRVALASPTDVAPFAERTGVHAVVLPNAVAIPTSVSRRPADPPDLLYLGNLTYRPNVEAAVVLALEVLPRVRAAGVAATVTLVGAFEPGGAIDALRGLEGVEVVGPVATVDPWYARAACVVVPLAAGSGTRIKLLEAFAHGVPVVCTPMAAAGLGVTDGTDVLLADAPDELAAHVVRVLEDPVLGERLATAARAVAVRHAGPPAAEAVRSFLEPPAR